MYKNVFRLVLVGFSLIVIPSLCEASFFESYVVGSDIEWNQMNKIQLASYRFSSPATGEKYDHAKAFIGEFKKQFWTRYKDGQSNYYQFFDAVNEMQFLVEHLNSYFGYMKRYERTGFSDYQDIALGYLGEVDQSYDRLRDIFH